MNKSQNQFTTLSEPDRAYIRDLCSRQPYDEVVPLLAKSRADGGLDILTSRSALCRFYTTSHIEPPRAVLAQYAASANVRHEQDSNAFLGAIRAEVEARVLENLRRGQALADMEKDFRLLKTTQTLYLADAQWRAKNPKAARAAYQHHVDHCASLSDLDFIPVQELTPSEASHPASLTAWETSDFERDVLQTRERHQIEAQHRQQLLATLRASGIGPQHLPEDLQTPPAATSHRPAPSAPHSPAASIPQPPAPKNPVIPPIPPNSTTPPAPTPPPQPQTPEPPKPRVPYVSATPKIGRNDPCRCGSGLKSKKCCGTSPRPPLSKPESESGLPLAA